MECLIAEPSDIHIEQSRIVLRDDEAHHASRVLRLSIGEELLITDLSGNCYQCVFEGEEKLGSVLVSASCQIQAILPNYGEPERNVLLIQGLIAQPSRMEMVLEKAVELGVSGIQPVATERSEKRGLKRDRSERILKAAVKQTRRARMPNLGELSSLRDALSEAVREGRRILLLHESAPDSDTLKAELGTLTSSLIAIVVGPEGGFSEQEVMMASSEFGATVHSLGNRRLRAETAAIAALALVLTD